MRVKFDVKSEDFLLKFYCQILLKIYAKIDARFKNIWGTSKLKIHVLNPPPVALVLVLVLVLALALVLALVLVLALALALVLLFRRINWPPKQVSSHYIVFSAWGSSGTSSSLSLTSFWQLQALEIDQKPPRILVASSPRETPYLPLLRPVDRETSWSDTTVQPGPRTRSLSMVMGWRSKR